MKRFSLHTAFQALTLSRNGELGASLSQMTENFHDSWRLRQVLKYILELLACKPRYLQHAWKSMSSRRLRHGKNSSVSRAPWRAPHTPPSPSQPRNPLGWAFQIHSGEFNGSSSLFGKFEKFCLNVYFIPTSWNGVKHLSMPTSLEWCVRLRV